MHKTGEETISGPKVFDSSLEGKIYLRNNFYKKDVAPSDYDTGSSIVFLDKDGYTTGYIEHGISTSSSTTMHLKIKKFGTDTDVGVSCVSYLTDNAFIPVTTGDTYLGVSSNRWKTIFATNGTINTSDERLKSSITEIPDAVLDAWGEIGFVQYQLNASVDKKGEGARIHSGLIAQRIDQAFSKHNLDASRYSLFCYDEWDAEPAEYDENGGRVKEARPAGNQYSLRYTEALCMEAAYQRRQNSRTESRFLDLEQRIALLEEKIKQEEK